MVVSAFHPSIESYSVFTHPTTFQFLKDVVRTFPPAAGSTPPWDPNLVLAAHMWLTFEPFAKYRKEHAAIKVAFLTVTSSMWRVDALGALWADPPYTIFHRNKVFLQLHAKFVTKVPVRL